MDASSNRRASPVLLGVVIAVILGLIVAALFAVDGDYEQADRPPPAKNAAAQGGAPPLVTVDCADTLGDVRAGEPGIPIDIPQPAPGKYFDYEVKINCAALPNNEWALVGPNLRGDEVTKAGFGYAQLFSVAQANLRPHPNTVHVYGEIKSPDTGDMTVEVKPESDAKFRANNQSNILGITFSVGKASAPKLAVDCHDEAHSLYPTEGEIVLPVALPFRSGVDLDIKCDGLADNRWTFENDERYVSGGAGRLGFFPTRSTLRLYPSFRTGAGYFDVRVKPVSGVRFHKDQRVMTLRFDVAPYKIRAIGDSWTAAFGFYGKDAKEMPLVSLLGCRPGDGALNDRCSSNGYLTGDTPSAPLQFTDDWGLANDISWAAKVAHAVPPQGTWNYKNVAVSGAEPDHFLPLGSLNYLLNNLVDENPDLTLITLGGNPILGDVLFGIKECEWSRVTPNGLERCAGDLINNTYKVPDKLARVYQRLLDAPRNHVVISSYMTIVPYIPTNTYQPNEWAVMARLLNGAIQRAVDKAKGAVGPDAAKRLFLTSPLTPIIGTAQSLGVGVHCKRGHLDFWADGSSVLTPQMQDWLNATATPIGRACTQGAQYESSRQWRDAGQEVWFNPGDFGTHLSRIGNEKLAKPAIDLIRANQIVP